jgi:hypothetical protein
MLFDMIKLLLILMLGLVVYIGMQPASPEALRESRERLRQSEQRLDAAKQRLGRAVEDTWRGAR